LQPRTPLPWGRGFGIHSRDRGAVPTVPPRRAHHHSSRWASLARSVDERAPPVPCNAALGTQTLKTTLVPSASADAYLGTDFGTQKGVRPHRSAPMEAGGAGKAPVMPRQQQSSCPAPSRTRPRGGEAPALPALPPAPQTPLPKASGARRCFFLPARSRGGEGGAAIVPFFFCTQATA